MTPNEYQTLAARTLIDKPDFEIPSHYRRAVTTVIALAGTLGTLAEYVKKGIFHQHGFLFTHYIEQLTSFANDAKILTQSDYSQAPMWDTRTTMLFWNIIGLIGEAGEIARLLIRYLWGDKLDNEKLRKEIGDCLWYLAAICTKADLSLEDVMQENINKLKLRYPNGFSADDSRKRVDVKE